MADIYVKDKSLQWFVLIMAQIVRRFFVKMLEKINAEEAS